ncbi:Homeobox protein prospero [Habropoda laboriosa]|uniref:Homeobox protein prospero n=1 Tax=Habropoda laboriosa TaxID=597456 RepID=A0A0L7QTX0_9HYME|nr:Homeobox protein prospero [Habropoda laboriosa]
MTIPLFPCTTPCEQHFGHMTLTGGGIPMHMPLPRYLNNAMWALIRTVRFEKREREKKNIEEPVYEEARFFLGRIRRIAGRKIETRERGAPSPLANSKDAAPRREHEDSTRKSTGLTSRDHQREEVAIPRRGRTADTESPRSPSCWRQPQGGRSGARNSEKKIKKNRGTTEEEEEETREKEKKVKRRRKQEFVGKEKVADVVVVVVVGGGGGGGERRGRRRGGGGGQGHLGPSAQQHSAHAAFGFFGAPGYGPAKMLNELLGRQVKQASDAGGSPPEGGHGMTGAGMDPAANLQSGAVVNCDDPATAELTQHMLRDILQGRKISALPIQEQPNNNNSIHSNNNNTTADLLKSQQQHQQSPQQHQQHNSDSARSGTVHSGGEESGDGNNVVNNANHSDRDTVMPGDAEDSAEDAAAAARAMEEAFAEAGMEPGANLDGSDSEQSLPPSPTQPRSGSVSVKEEMQDSMNIKRSPSHSPCPIVPKTEISSPTTETKRARVENIVSTMRSSPALQTGTVNGCKKRKLYQPQQQTVHHVLQHSINDAMLDDEEELEEEEDPSPIRQKREEKDNLQTQLKNLHEQLAEMQQKYNELTSRIDSDTSESIGAPLSPQPPLKPPRPHPSPYNGLAALPTEHPHAAAAAIPPPPPSQTQQQSQSNTGPSTPQTPQMQPASTPLQHKDFQERMNVFRGAAAAAGSTGSHITDEDLQSLSDTLKAEITMYLSNLIDKVVTRIGQQWRFLGKQGEAAQVAAEQLNKDLLLANQILERKSPRTKVVDRGAPQPPGGPNGPRGPHNGGPPPPQSTGFPQIVSMRGRTHGPHSGPTENNLNQINQLPPHVGQVSGLFQTPKPPVMYSMGPMQAQQQQQQQQHQQQLEHQQREQQQRDQYCNLRVEKRESRDSEQDEALSLVMTPKKKRHKVTDTRITPRTVSRILAQEGSCSQGGSESPPPPPPPRTYHAPPPMLPVSLPTSVAIPNPSLHESQVFSPYSPFFNRHAGHAGQVPPPGAHHLPASPPSAGVEVRDSPPLPHPPSILHPALLAAAQHGSPDYGHLRMDSNDRPNDCNPDDLSYDGIQPTISFSNAASLRNKKERKKEKRNITVNLDVSG